MIRPLNEQSISPGADSAPGPGKSELPAEPSASSPPPRRSVRVRRLRFIALSVLTGLVLAAGLAPFVLQAIIRRQLRAMAAESLVGDLHVGSISFSLPWTVNFADTTFVARGPSGESIEMFRIPRLRMQFAHSPLASGPAAIQITSIENPVLHLVQTAHEIVGVRSDLPPSKRSKFSDVANLQHFVISGGEFVLEDRTDAASLPTQWRKVSISMDHDGESPAAYAYRLSAEGAADIVLNSAGKADLDALVLDVQSCSAEVIAGRPAHESGLPAAAQEALRHVGAAGTVSIRASGIVPIARPQNITYRAALEIRDGAMNIAEWQTRFDRLNSRFAIDATAGSLHPKVRFAALDAAAGDASLHLEDAPVAFDLVGQTWSANLPKVQVATGRSRQNFGEEIRAVLSSWNVHGNVELSIDAAGPLNSADLSRYRGEMSLKPGDLSLQPPQMNAPLDRFTEATLKLEKGTLQVRQLRAMCGDDILFIREASLGLGQLPARFSIDQASGAVTFAARHGAYPPKIAEHIDRYAPVGPFFFTGSFATDLDSEAPANHYDLEVGTQRGRFDLIDHRIPVYNVQGLVHITPGAVEIKSLDAEVIGGRLSSSGRIDMGKQPEYHLQLDGTNLDLRELAQRMAAPGHPAAPVSGRAKLNIQCAGIIPENGSALDKFKGAGTFDIRQGDYFEVPVLRAIARDLKAKEAAIVSDAAAQFHVADKKIRFDRAVISAPVLGVEGTGTIDFDGNMEFHKVTALAGGDWKRNTGEATPVGQVVGKIQSALNEVTRVVWYDLDVTGTVNAPIVKPTPAPFIVKPVLHFKEMLDK